MNKIIVTGCAGFIGSKVAEMLLQQGYEVIGIDNLNEYYDVRLKLWRLKKIKEFREFHFYQVDIENYEALKIIFQICHPDAVINEAALAGVRYSMENPYVYLSTNAQGCLNLLELCKIFNVPKFVLASTSSLYAGQALPFKEDLEVSIPISPYAATKKSAEVMSYTYHYLYGLDVSVLRYFTVYGPAGRPDMSYFRFIKWILEGRPLVVYGDGSQRRDFTYIDDIASGTIKALMPVGYEIINLGNSNPNRLLEMINLIEEHTGKKANIENKLFHIADMKATWAKIEKAKELLGWEPQVSLTEGISKTVEWTKDNWSLVKDINI